MESTMNVLETTSAVTHKEAAPEPPCLDGWNVLRLLAQGAHAEAWIVESTTPHQNQCVLKIARSDDDVASLQRERRFSQGLEHPHIVAFRGSVATSRGEGTLWEYCPAGDALSLIHVLGPLRVPQAVTVLVPLAQALDYAHEQGVVHGDVSPGNVVFDTQGRPKLCDVGEARTVSSPDRWTGTEGFSAPELDLHEHRVGLQPAADVYSLAALGWFLLTGRLPGDESRRPALNVLLPEAHDEVAELLEASLNPNPQFRPSLAEFSVACYSWGDPEPLQLHALVDERTALLLPTRYEPGQRPSTRPRRARLKIPRLRGRHGRVCGIGLHPRHRPARGRKSLRGAHTRLGLGLGSAVLGVSMILASLWTITEPETSTGTDHTTTAVASTPPWDSIVDEWSQRRAAAFTERDPAAVSSYAVDAGNVAEDDRVLIQSLHDQDIVYEDLTMSARVDEADVDGATANLLVEWSMSPYAVRADDGSTDHVEKADENSEQVWIESMLVEDEWRIASVNPVSKDGTPTPAKSASEVRDAAG